MGVCFVEEFPAVGRWLCEQQRRQESAPRQSLDLSGSLGPLHSGRRQPASPDCPLTATRVLCCSHEHLSKCYKNIFQNKVCRGGASCNFEMICSVRWAGSHPPPAAVSASPASACPLATQP